jgi:hypothetical protein
VIKDLSSGLMNSQHSPVILNLRQTVKSSLHSRKSIDFGVTMTVFFSWLQNSDCLNCPRLAGISLLPLPLQAHKTPQDELEMGKLASYRKAWTFLSFCPPAQWKPGSIWSDVQLSSLLREDCVAKRNQYKAEMLTNFLESTVLTKV